MTKADFLQLLERALSQLSDEERRANLEYYSELLDDMMEEGMSVRQAAAAVGFSDQNYFSTVFKRTTGAAPRIYMARREHT